MQLYTIQVDSRNTYKILIGIHIKQAQSAITTESGLRNNAWKFYTQ